jgi:bifunctional non-homologous end joining protein LigD
MDFARMIPPGSMLASKLDRPPTGPDWTFEIKFDGIRAFAIICRSALTLVSRRGTPMTSWFPELSPIGELIDAPDVILDGEIILGSGSVDSFNDLLRRVRSRGRALAVTPVTFVAFDAVSIGGLDLADLELHERRDRLRALVTEGPRLVLSRVYDDGAALYAAALEHGLEGIVAKRRSSKYEPGRSRAWVKIKVPGASERHEWTGRAGRNP